MRVGFLALRGRLCTPFSEAGHPVHLLQKEPRKDDPDPKALSCYGLYLPELAQTWIRFVDGRPVSSITTRFLE